VLVDRVVEPAGQASHPLRSAPFVDVAPAGIGERFGIGSQAG
jgi:hypothetical protein